MLLFNLRERGVECGVSVSVLPIVGAERSEGKGRGGEAGRHGVPLRNGRRRGEKRRTAAPSRRIPVSPVFYGDKSGNPELKSKAIIANPEIGNLRQDLRKRRFVDRRGQGETVGYLFLGWSSVPFLSLLCPLMPNIQPHRDILLLGKEGSYGLAQLGERTHARTPSTFCCSHGGAHASSAGASETNRQNGGAGRP